MAGFYSCLRGENDSSMASGLPDVTANQETAETPEECQGKKKSKFQTFKNFFVKKKRKEASAPTGESPLKSSQSSDNVNGPEAAPTQSDADQDSGSNVNMGGKAMSHDSVFVSDSPSSEANDALASSPDNQHGKVKSLQMQLKQAIRLGSPPSLICGKKGEDGGALSEDDGLPCSPPEISTLHTVLTGSAQGPSNLGQRRSSLSLEGSDSEDEQMSLEASSRPVSPLVSLPLDFSEPANFTACLDNSAARHRIAVKQRASAKRKPASRELFESSKVKILSGRVALRAEEEPSSAVITEPSAEEMIKDVVMSETDAGGEAAEAEVPAIAKPASATKEEEAAAPDQPAQDRDEDASSSSSEADLDEQKSLDFLALPGGHHKDTVLDSEGEAPAEEAGSLLQEVLSSLECPLTSAFVLKPDARDLHLSEDQSERSRADGLQDKRMDEPSSSPAGNQDENEEEEAEEEAEEEEEEVDQPLAIDMSCGLDSRDEDEQLAKKEELTESDEGEDEEAEVEEGAAEGLPEKEPEPTAEDVGGIDEQDKAVEEVIEQEDVMEEDEQEAVVKDVVEEVIVTEEVLLEEVEKGEAVKEVALAEAVEKEESDMEEALVEEVQEEEVVMEEAVKEEVEEADTVMEEDKGVIEEDEVVVEEVVMQQELEVEEEVEEVQEELGGVVVGVEMTPEAPQQKASAEPDQEQEEYDEEDVEDLEVELATKIHEPEDPEESMEEEPEAESADQDSGEDDAQDILSESWCYARTDSMENSECTVELFVSEVGDDTTPPKVLGVALSPSSEEPSTPLNKPSPSADIAQLGSGPRDQQDHGNVQEATESSKARFTIAPAWQRSLSGGTPKEPAFPSPIKPEAFQPVGPEAAVELAVSPDPPQSPVPVSPVRQSPAQGTATAENPFGIKLRKTTVLLRYGAEGPGDAPVTGLPVEPEESNRRPLSGQTSTKPALLKKPDPLEDSSSTKLRKTPEPALSRGSAGSVTSPSWISVAKQKQKSFQENPIEETPGRKSSIETDEANLASSPVTVSCSLEISKPTAVEKEGKRTLAHSPSGPAGQDEPPWLALAKKKAKAWSEMPQIVQ